MMKLYIWNEPYDIPYGGAFAFAIAESADSARAAIRGGIAAPFGLTGGAAKNVPEALDIEREPDEVHDGPFGRVYEWEE